MKKSVFFLLCLFSTIILRAQQKVIPLYEGTAPGTETWNWNEAENDQNMWQTKVVYNVVQPSLTVFQPAAGKANGTAVIICPGGAFFALSINSEGFDVASWLQQKGVTCFVLKYRLAHTTGNDPTAEVAAKMGKKEFEEETGKVIPLAIADGRAAIAYVRKHAAEYNVLPDRIGIMGFSAGGTLASAALFNYNNENKPDFAAPVYPYFPKEMYGTVGAGAPPLFITAASDDALGLAPHSVDLYNYWMAAKQPAELHMYAKGGHGFGMRKQNLPSDQWIDRFGEWLDQQGFLKRPAFNPEFALFEQRVYPTVDGNILPYRILYPENYDKNKKYPLVLFLHGSGERGKDNEKQLTHGARLFLSAENRKKFPAIVLFPQCPDESFWATSTIDRTVQPARFELDYSGEANWPLTAANELVKKMIAEGAVDPGRVYITGLSMGGMGTFESVFRYPNLYAAALPICGGGDVEEYDKRVSKTAFWIFHGSADRAVDVKMSRDMVDKLKKLKVELKYSEYPGVNHNSWDNAFAEPDYLDWMLRHKRKK
ncbi:MAG: prolyl oligopeptidase family serine peptidase [Sphingobacteriales bacterium]|nr:prolyl oligopeptidase family serine peptidase [Sphingobacteriales bacterium]